MHMATRAKKLELLERRRTYETAACELKGA
jgi:hypothetical protein